MFWGQRYAPLSGLRRTGRNCGWGRRRLLVRLRALRHEPGRQGSNHHVSVIAADTVHVGCQVDLVVGSQFTNPGQGLQNRAAVHNGGIGGIVTIGEHRAMMRHQDQLGEHHCWIGGFEVAELRLDIAEMEKMGETLFDGLLFNRIQEQIGAGEDIQVPDLAFIDGRLGITVINGACIGIVRWREQMFRDAGGHTDTAQFTQYGHMAFPGLAIGRQHLDCGTLTHHIAAGVFIEKPTLIFRKQPQALEGQQNGGVQIGIHATGDNKIVVPGFETFHSQVQSNRGRGT